jgi:hypothetical protein
MLGSSVEARVHRSDGVHAQHQGHVMPNIGSGFFLEPMFSRELGSGVVLSLDFLLYFLVGFILGDFFGSITK